MLMVVNILRLKYALIDNFIDTMIHTGQKLVRKFGCPDMWSMYLKPFLPSRILDKSIFNLKGVCFVFSVIVRYRNSRT